MGLFDVHAHLTDARLAAQEADVLARAEAAGVTTIISNGLNPTDNAAVAALASRSSLVKPAFGLYPVDAVLPEMLAMGEDYAYNRNPCPADEAITWVRDHIDECVAVGEIGLDRYWVPEPLWELQEQRFRELVQLAMDADKPIIIHTRKAERRALEVLIEMGATRVNWHCYSSKVKFGRTIAEHGHYLSIPANARKAQNFSKLLATLPREQVLLETDCPYLGPVRDELNEPANVAVTAALASELWDVPIDAVQTQLEANFEALFGFAP
ncbi:MAG: TatD family hydrolase [Proteobacteria bacterium]|nr:TatD family hydrolase [Pseudomonadota bacterium]